MLGSKSESRRLESASWRFGSQPWKIRNQVHCQIWIFSLNGSICSKHNYTKQIKYAGNYCSNWK